LHNAPIRGHSGIRLDALASLPHHQQATQPLTAEAACNR
jgi:hypothetical protein